MYAGGYTVLNTTPFALAAPGILANDTGGTAPLTPHLENPPAHGTIIINSDGSFSYTAAPGYTGTDSCTYYDTDSAGDPSSTATISFTVYAGALSDVDQTKIPADTLNVPMQVLGGGHEDPNTGLVNDFHRYYDPATGRWISEDPAGFAGDDTNLARYSSNAITSRDDETGLWTFSIGLSVNITIPTFFGPAINVGAGVSLNVGPDGAYVAPGGAVGLGLGANASVDIPITVTNAPNATSLAGLSYYGGVAVDIPYGGYAGYTYIPSGGYWGGTIAPGYGAGVAIVPFGAAYQAEPWWWLWQNPSYSAPAPPNVPPPVSSPSQTNGPSSGDGRQYLNPGP